VEGRGAFRAASDILQKQALKFPGLYDRISSSVITTFFGQYKEGVYHG
jgi:hypothetical protein